MGTIGPLHLSTVCRELVGNEYKQDFVAMKEDMGLMKTLYKRLRTTKTIYYTVRPSIPGASYLVDWYDGVYDEEFVAAVYLFRKLASIHDHDMLESYLRDVKKYVSFDVVRALCDAVSTSWEAETIKDEMKKRGL